MSGLKIVGMDDLWAGRFDLSAVLPQLRADDASLVLVHNPDTVDGIGWGDIVKCLTKSRSHFPLPVACLDLLLFGPRIVCSTLSSTRGKSCNDRISLGSYAASALLQQQTCF